MLSFNVFCERVKNDALKGGLKRAARSSRLGYVTRIDKDWLRS